ncbi:MAG TPA: GHKL domain-containing protein [Lachnospiraceae bacterium]|nr:GHKL domain-containing protein [Lachnospiraceae bacterium]
MEAGFLGEFPWVLCAYFYTLMESLAIRDSFDIALYRKKIKQSYYILAVMLLFLWMIIADEAASKSYEKSILILLFAFGMVFILYEGKVWQKILTVIAVSLVCLLFDLVNLQIMSHLLDEDIGTFAGNDVYLYYMALTSKLTQMLLIKMLKCFVGRNKIKAMYKIDRVLCILVPIAIMLNAYTSFMKNLIRKDITEWDIYGILLLVFLGSMLYFIMYRMGEYYDEMSRSKVLDNQMRSEIEYMESLQQTHKKIRQIAHGFENQLSIVNTLLKNEEYDKAKEYLSEISNAVEKNVLPVHTNNIVIDAVLNQMFIVAVSKKITMNFNIQDLGTLRMNVSDMAAILNNALNNAIEACDKLPGGTPRIIEIQISNEEQELIISIQNTTAVEEMEIEDNMIITTKSDTENHGLGMESIKTVVEKYHGKLFLECKNYNFHLMVVIG